MKINGKDYGNKELDFVNVICDLEDMGIDIMSMTGENIKPFTLCRAIISVYTEEKDMKECGRILSEHLKNDGTLEEILDPFMEAMESAGFGKKAEEETTPQDHKEPKKTTKKKTESAAEQVQ